MEQQVYEMENMQHDLVNQLKDLEWRNESLESKLNECIKVNEQLEKGQAIYIAKRNDRIDKALGNYLNLYPERQSLKILFLRESEGVYQFG